MRDTLRTALIAWAVGLAMLSAGALSPSAATAQEPDQTYDGDGPAAGEPASEEPAAEAPVVEAPVVEAETRLMTQFTDWVIASGDNHGLPFVIIDKVEAEVSVFAADGQLRGAAPALLGLARGDDSVPGIGDRKLSSISPEERTTPAGRFIAGFRPDGKILWVDYETAISMHPVPVANAKEQRLRRLQTPTPKDNRITYGCINVSAAFYEDVVRPTFTGTSGVVYILPETRLLDEVFLAFRTQEPSALAAAPSSIGP